MQEFASFITKLGTSNSTTEKVETLLHYFSVAHEKDKVWVIALFSGRRPKRIVKSSLLQQWCTEMIQLPQWLFEECYHTVGDLAETIALLLPATKQSTYSTQDTLYSYLEQFLQLEKADEEQKKAFVVEHWLHMNQEERFVFNKIITGGFRIGVSQGTMINALAKHMKMNTSVVAHRISGKWNPSTTPFRELLSEDAIETDVSKPYPFYLSYALDQELTSLGEPDEWQAEWKWDGIRGQIISRKDDFFVWSRGEELLTEKFPEYQAFKHLLPLGTVLDGEIISMNPEEKELKPLPFSALQTRIGRKNITKKQLKEAPAAFIAYDLLEYKYKDLRTLPMQQRRAILASLIQSINHSSLRLSPLIDFSTWEELKIQREQARERGSEGVMLKKKDSLYQAGRKRGSWWKWKMDPLVIDCVLIYAQKGHGRRSNLYTDYTFAVKNGEQLVTFTKAYSGLTDKEFKQVDAFIKKNSLEKFGPVRTVKPELVFEIAFEGIAASSRHKSGVALRFPRMNRWRKDKSVDEINTLEDLMALLYTYGK